MILVFIFALLLSSTTHASHNFPIAKPNCVDRCGNISIPYPAGTTPECYHNPIFWVTCNHTFSPPKLFLQNSSSEITALSLDGQAKTTQFIARDCYARNGTRVINSHPWMRLATYTTFNNTANKFTMVGCDAEASVSGLRRNGRKFRTGCTATCEAKDDLKEGSCMGLGCCQTSIPDDVYQLSLELKSYSNYSHVWDFNNCSYAFVADDSAFRFSPENLTNLRDVVELPLVVDWVIGNGTCVEAQTNSTTYPCVSPNSSCYELENGYGYRCRCHEGYQGNPYLTNGCQDIDECEDSSANDCTKSEYCSNTAGNYTCSCPKGHSGKGRGRDGCAKKQNMKFSYILIGIAFGISTLLIAAILLHMELKRRSLKGMKQKYFLKNGSILLQEKLTTMGRSPNMVKIFTASDLETATKDFHSSMIVGQGGFGTVYKGVLPDKSIVAIKKSKKVDPNLIEQFINEVFVLSQVNHINVVRLLGCCLETEVPLLVYEFINNGTLAQHVHSQEKASDLQTATKDFHSSMIVGQGGFGTVYKGLLHDYRLVAIKKSKRIDPNQNEQFINEVFVLSQVNHKNIVRLIGCCLETEVPLLVYEFISNGTLSAHLHNEVNARLFNWGMRLKIAAETAGVLSYLHSAASTPIIHRDVKSDNILLDQDFTAKVSDFGASKLVPQDFTQLSTIVQGTLGYLDPEYMQTNQLTEKSDVYSFGVVLLELLTRRKALSFDKPEEEKNLANFFLYIAKQNRLSEILDVDILHESNMEQISEVARLAKGCLQVRGEDRPTMKEVAMELEGLILARKHSWSRNEENADEMEILIDKSIEVNHTANDEGNSTNVGYDSVGYDSLMLAGGR